MSLMFDGIEIDERRLDYVGTEIAEELNVKKVQLVLDDGRVFEVEHDPVRSMHRSAVRTIHDMDTVELKRLLCAVRKAEV